MKSSPPIPTKDATTNDGLRIKRVAGGYMVQYPPLFSVDGNLLFVIYDNSIQAFNVTTGELVRSYESKADEGHLVGMVVECTHGKIIQGCTVDGFILSWKIDSGLLTDRVKVVKNNFVVESFHALYDQNSVASFLIHGTSTTKLIIQYCPYKRMVLEVVRPAIHTDNSKSKSYDMPVSVENHDASDVRIVVAPGGHGLHYFAYIAKTRWYWARLKPVVRVDSMPHCSGIQPIMLACHPTEAILAVGDEIGRVVLYRNFLTKEKVIAETYHWHPHAVNCLAFSSNGTHFYSGGKERVLVKWKIGQEEKAGLIPRLTDSIVNIAIGPDNLKIVVCTADNSIQIMNALHKRTGTVQSFSKITSDVPGDDLFPASLRMNPRTHAIIMNGRVGCIQFFSTYTKSMLYTLDITQRNYNTNEDRNVIHNTVVTNVAVNSHWLATVENWNDHHSAAETRLKFWKYNESYQTYSLSTNLENIHDGGVFDISFSNSSRERNLQCATAGMDNRIKVWSLEEIQATNGTEKLVWACAGSVHHRHLPVRSISFSQDASLLAGGFGNVLCIWNSETLKLKCALSAPSGYDGCVNKALLILPTIVANEKVKQMEIERSEYEDTSSHTITTKITSANSKISPLRSNKGKTISLDDTTRQCAKERDSSRVYLERKELIKHVSEKHKKYIMQKVQANSKMNMTQRAECFYFLRIGCKANERMETRINNRLLGSRSVKPVEHYMRKLYDGMSSTRRFRVIRRQRNYERRRLPPLPFENGIAKVFSEKKINQINLAKKPKIFNNYRDKSTKTCNPIKSFAQIYNVLFCYGQFSHLVVISTENRLVVWNLLNLKIQVSAALTIDRIVLDPITNLIATFTKHNELYVFLPNIPMPLYHRINMPKVVGAVWVPRRYPSSQSFNVNWQATSQLFFLNAKQELQHLVSDNDEESLGPGDSDEEETLIADEYVNQLSMGLKTPFAAMFAKQAIGSKVERNPKLHSGTFIGLERKSVVRDVIASSAHTMAPVNLLCKDFLRKLLVTEENRVKEKNTQSQTILNHASAMKTVAGSGNVSLYGAHAIFNEQLNADEVEVRENSLRLSEKIKARKTVASAVNQMQEKQSINTVATARMHLGKCAGEIIDIIF